MYTLENRAIPSVIDGFKPTQRKIIFIADKVWKGSNDK
jgi:DNA gyrase/topoisomerase IV subunit A